jgi:hypothetical protein
VPETLFEKYAAENSSAENLAYNNYIDENRKMKVGNSGQTHYKRFYIENGERE